jgi:HAD superfamily hydrolase (TIGR01509 family)
LNQFDLIIFDCDGVLVDSEIILCGVYADYFTSAGFPHTAAEVSEKYLGVSDETTVAMLAAEGMMLPTTFSDDIQYRGKVALASDLEPISGIREALNRLNRPVCVASSGDHVSITRSLTTTGLLELFSPNLFSASQVENGKPAPDLFLFAAKCMGATPENALVIEDSPVGVQGGVAAGMTVVGFTGGSHIQPGHGDTLLNVGAHHILDDMAILPDLLEALSE